MAILIPDSMTNVLAPSLDNSSLLSLPGYAAISTNNSNPLAGVCFPPFVRTDDPRHQISFLPGCGLSCVDTVWYNTSEYSGLRQMIITLALLSLILTGYTVLSSLVDNRQRQFPSVLLVNINICLFVSSIGWIWTYMEDTNIMCYEDGTLRLDAPSESGDFKCVMTFVIIFYFGMAARVWFVLLAIAWNFAFLHLGKPRQVSPATIRKLLIIHHLIAWLLPLLLTVAAVATMQLDGLWLGNICHISLIRQDNYTRILLFLVPEGITVLLGAIFLTRGVIHLERIRRQQVKDTSLGGKSDKLIKTVIFKIGVFSFIWLFMHVMDVAIHVTESLKKDSWILAFQKFIGCRAIEVLTALAVGHPSLATVVAGDTTSCQITSKPSLSLVYLEYFSRIVLGVAMGCWGLNSHTFQKWKDFFCGCYRKLVRYHGGFDLAVQWPNGTPAADQDFDGVGVDVGDGGRRMSDRSAGRDPIPAPPVPRDMHLEMYINPIANACTPLHLMPPSPVSPVNLDVNPISYHGNRVNVTQSRPAAKTGGSLKVVTTTNDHHDGEKEPLSQPLNHYGTWPSGSSPNKKPTHTKKDHPLGGKPTPPKCKKRDSNVELISHKKTPDPDKLYDRRDVTLELNDIIPHDQTSLPKSIVGTGRYVLQTASHDKEELDSVESALSHGKPLSDKDKKRAVVVIEMTPTDEKWSEV